MRLDILQWSTLSNTTMYYSIHFIRRLSIIYLHTQGSDYPLFRSMCWAPFATFIFILNSSYNFLYFFLLRLIMSVYSAAKCQLHIVVEHKTISIYHKCNVVFRQVSSSIESGIKPVLASSVLQGTQRQTNLTPWAVNNLNSWN